MTFKARRKAFMEKMDGGLALLRSAPVFLRSMGEETESLYRQDSDFYYLTGFTEPEAVCLLAPEHPEHQFVLFVRPRDKTMEIWNGKRAGTEGAVQDYGADIAYTIDQLDEVLAQYLRNASTLYYSSGQAKTLDEQLIEQWGRLQGAGVPVPSQIVTTGEIFDELRLVKMDDEIELLRRACEISAEAHKAAMQALKPGMYEYEIQATLEYVFRKNGAIRNGYTPIVGSGSNATTLHYVQNTRKMEDGELLLIDAGAEYGYYSGDITRTMPINGRFTPAQRAIYELVLKAERAAIDYVKPGIKLSDLQSLTTEIITEGLVELGILQGSVKELIEKKAYFTYYMHGVSHWLGLDVHDRGKYGKGEQEVVLAPGMVFTIEPGIYIAAENTSVDPAYRNIGIRIEDNVLVTENGCENLTKLAPKTVEEIEAIMAS